MRQTTQLYLFYYYLLACFRCLESLRTRFIIITICVSIGRVIWEMESCEWVSCQRTVTAPIWVLSKLNEFMIVTGTSLNVQSFHECNSKINEKVIPKHSLPCHTIRYNGSVMRMTICVGRTTISFQSNSFLHVLSNRMSQHSQINAISYCKRSQKADETINLEKTNSSGVTRANCTVLNK